ncbi:Fic family protein [Sphingobium sp. D43FB]|uniref:Fic family protein n=1 Tax=Sphingobium sp. D43FB TaxID=2017595 RepID=UPI0020D015B9|nr:Fic family protein [Sphingobium sp. D43FB]
MLNRDSVQSSLRRQFGLDTDHRRVPPAERGIADMMVALYRGYADPLSDESLFAWHQMILDGRQDVRAIGRYRDHDDPMQVVSGPLHKPKVHFEAPSSSTMTAEMRKFVTWFSAPAPDGKSPLPALTRAGIAHLYFVSIHPFEDGNGRIARALAEKVLSQAIGQPSLIALSHVIQRKRSAYYDALEAANKGNEVTPWLRYFATTILDAQQHSLALIDFLLAKTRFYDRFRSRLNERQAKVISRMFREGLDGFTGGLRASNYITITETSRATATRDLHELVAMGAFTSSGALKCTHPLSVALPGT